MCDAVGTAHALSRRQRMAIVGADEAGVVAMDVAAPAMLATEAAAPRGHGDPDAWRHRTRLILLGVAGGPVWSGDVHGISSAIVVDGRVYVVDCGDGVWQQLERADLGGDATVFGTLDDLRAVFLTHLHSDHSIDYNNLLLFGIVALQDRVSDPVHVYGPGDRG